MLEIFGSSSELPHFFILEEAAAEQYIIGRTGQMALQPPAEAQIVPEDHGVLLGLLCCLVLYMLVARTPLRFVRHPLSSAMH